MKPNLTWVDTHCHLEMLKEEPDTALEKSTALGMETCLTIGTKHSSNLKVCEYVEQYPSVYGAVGIHPHEADAAKVEELGFIRESLLANQKLVAIGECGFDFFYSHSGEGNQKRIFYQQLEIACDVKLPLVIHSREAEKQTFEMLADFKGKGLTGVFHSYTSGLDLAKAVLDLGFYISVNGICTFPKSDAVREVLKIIPKKQLLLETDSPFLSPVPMRGKPNIPGNVSYVGAFVADYLGMEQQELKELCYQNTLELFSRIPQ